MLLKYQGVLNNKSKHIGDDAASMDEYRVLLNMSSASEKTLRIWRKKTKKGISLFQGKGDDWVSSSPRRLLQLLPLHRVFTQCGTRVSPAGWHCRRRNWCSIRVGEHVPAHSPAVSDFLFPIESIADGSQLLSTNQTAGVCGWNRFAFDVIETGAPPANVLALLRPPKSEAAALANEAEPTEPPALLAVAGEPTNFMFGVI